jgi:Flp pilus assembly protein TadD
MVVALTPFAAAAPQSSSEPAALAFALLNEARIANGLSPLRYDLGLARIAAHHSQEQAARERVGHNSDEYGLSTERRVRITYPTVPRLAENVARNSTVERLHAALLRSEGHRRNRMDPRFTHVGIGIAMEHEHLMYLTEIFVTAPPEGDLGDPVTFYFEATPGSYEREEAPLADASTEVFRVGPPGPNDPEHWTNLGIDAFSRGNTEAAEAHFRRAIELKDDYVYARYNLARVLVNQGRPAEAVELLDEILEANPDDYDARVTRGTAALLLQDFSGAEAAFRRVIEARPQNAAAWYNLGLALEYSERRAEAEAAYRQALEIDPDLRAAQVGLGRVIRR